MTPELMLRIGGDCMLWGRDANICAEGGTEFRAPFDDNVKMIFAADGQSFTLFDGSGEVKAKRIVKRRERRCWHRITITGNDPADPDHAAHYHAPWCLAFA